MAEPSTRPRRGSPLGRLAYSSRMGRPRVRKRVWVAGACVLAATASGSLLVLMEESAEPPPTAALSRARSDLSAILTTSETGPSKRCHGDLCWRVSGRPRVAVAQVRSVLTTLGATVTSESCTRPEERYENCRIRARRGEVRFFAFLVNPQFPVKEPVFSAVAVEVL